MHWEQLLEQPSFDLRRSGRFLVADLKEPHRVLSTSVRNGGQVDEVRHLLNHQSCEGSGHLARHSVIVDAGLEAATTRCRAKRVCRRIRRPSWGPPRT